jgi:glucose-6-phosphate-specific signal transduction histidine kinase
MLAFLTFTPAILSWASARRVGIHRSPHSMVEAAALLSTLAIFGYLVLLAPWKTLSSGLLYGFVPLLLWATLRFGSLGVSTSMIVISFLSLWGATHGHGPFTGSEPFGNVLSLQLFLIFAAIPFMTLAAVVEDRERSRLVEKELSRRLISAQERERIRIARELHDDVCQRLALLAIKIRKAAKSDGNGQVSVAEQLEHIWQQCSSLTDDVQALSHELHPSVLEHVGLSAAVNSYCWEIAQQNGVVVELSNGNLPRSLSQDVSLSVFRVVQEALRNAVRYSGQKHVRVCLQENSGQLELEVSDQGIGFDVTNIRENGGLGLVSMAERIYHVNGIFSIDSQPNAGTRIRARVPLAAPSAFSN